MVIQEMALIFQQNPYNEDKLTALIHGRGFMTADCLDKMLKSPKRHWRKLDAVYQSLTIKTCRSILHLQPLYRIRFVMENCLCPIISALCSLQLFLRLQTV